MLSLGVETKVVGHIPQLAPNLVRREWRVFVKDVIGNFLHEPVERLALQLLLDRQLGSDIAHVDVASERLSGVEVLLVLGVEPGLDDASVAGQRMGCIRRSQSHSPIYMYRILNSVTHL